MVTSQSTGASERSSSSLKRESSIVAGLSTQCPQVRYHANLKDAQPLREPRKLCVSTDEANVRPKEAVKIWR